MTPLLRVLSHRETPGFPACINRIWRRFRVSPFLVRAASRGNGKARLLVFAVAFLVHYMKFILEYKTKLVPHVMSRGAAPYPSRKFQWKNTTKHGGHFPPPDHSQFITIQNFIRVFRGYRTAARPPNGDGCHPACIALASGLFAAGGCGVPVPQAFMGIGKTQKGLPVPPRLLHRFTGSPETFCGALLNAAH